MGDPSHRRVGPHRRGPRPGHEDRGRVLQLRGRGGRHLRGGHPRGPGIKDYGDLAGKTTSINALRTLGYLTLMGLEEQGGSDPADVKVAEMPFQDMPAQLEQIHAIGQLAVTYDVIDAEPDLKDMIVQSFRCGYGRIGGCPDATWGSRRA